MTHFRKLVPAVLAGHGVMDMMQKLVAALLEGAFGQVRLAAAGNPVEDAGISGRYGMSPLSPFCPLLPVKVGMSPSSPFCPLWVQARNTCRGRFYLSS